MIVLHLFDNTCDVEDRGTRELLRQSPANSITSTMMGVGPGEVARDVFDAARRVWGCGADVVHAWGRAALRAAALGRGARIVHSPTDLSPAAIRELRWISRLRNMHIVCRSDFELRAMHAAGLGTSATLIRPALEALTDSPASLTRAQARAALDIAPDQYVLLAVGESTRAAAHESVVWAAGILNVLDPRCKLLLWGRGTMAENAVRLAGKMRQRDMVIVAQTDSPQPTPWESLAFAADVAVVTPIGPVATLPIASCMMHGVPIVSTTHPSTHSFLMADTARLATDPSPRALARCVLDVREDPHGTTARAAHAKVMANQLFGPERMQLAYAQLIHSILRGTRVATISTESSKERNMAESIFSNQGGETRGGLDRYLGPEAKDFSKMPPLEDPDAPPDRQLDCEGADANEPVCEIARAEEDEREIGSNAT